MDTPSLSPAPELPLVAHARGGSAEDPRDREVLAWIARFRFVDAGVLAGRFGVSRQRMNARPRRLEAAAWSSVGAPVS
jgi:hypothetical protein